MSSPSDSQFGFPVVQLPPSAEQSADTAIKFLVQRLVERGEIRPEYSEQVTAQILHRESLGSTAIGGGVAIPHSRSDLVTRIVGIVGRSEGGVRWQGALDGAPVRTVCLLVGARDRPAENLRELERLSRLLRPPCDDNPAPPA